MSKSKKYTVTEAARMVGCSREAMYEWIKKGIMKIGPNEGFPWARITYNEIVRMKALMDLKKEKKGLSKNTKPLKRRKESSNEDFKNFP